MHHGPEVRVLLLDPDAITTTLGIDPAWSLSQPRTKPVLRTLLDRMVPVDAVATEKLGFSLPLGDCLTGPLAPFVEDSLFAQDLWPNGVFDAAAAQRLWDEHRSDAAQHTILLWGLLGA